MSRSSTARRRWSCGRAQPTTRSPTLSQRPSGGRRERGLWGLWGLWFSGGKFRIKYFSALLPAKKLFSAREGKWQNPPKPPNPPFGIPLDPHPAHQRTFLANPLDGHVAELISSGWSQASAPSNPATPQSG